MTRRLLVVALATFVLSAGSESAALAQWVPPIGIPAPPFGITQTAPSVPSPWTVQVPGFYYVDATQPTATDSSNAFGTPARPRRTIPTVLPAGSVVELHGTYDANMTSPNGILAQGTAASPVFIRGTSQATRPLIRNEWEVRGTYIIMENLQFANFDGNQTGDLVLLAPINGGVIRHSEFSGNLNGGGMGVVSWDGSQNSNSVIWDVNIHDNGDVNANFDQDVHGIAVSNHVDHLWVLDSTLARNSGDGIQINAGSAQLQATTHHIYVGRNTAFSNKQTGFWSKQAVDVVFSQNHCYNHRPSNSSFGQCMGYQYGTEYAWFLFNHIHDSDTGIAVASDSDLGTGTQSFFIGNWIHAIHTSDPAGFNPGTSWNSAGILLAGGQNRHVINNTMYDVDAGINVPAPDGTLEVADNIIANVTQALAYHMFIEMPSLVPNFNAHHNILQGDPRINLGSTTYHLTAAQLAAMQSKSADPQFVNGLIANFHLQGSSPAIDAGEMNAVYGTFAARYGINIAFDPDGTPRPMGAANDIGAYEFTGCPVTLSTQVPRVGSGASSVGVGVTAGSCTWTAASMTPWITITSGSSGTGNGTVQLSVPPNPLTTPRRGLLTISGVIVQLTQSPVAFTPDGHPNLFWVNDSTRQATMWDMGGTKGNTMSSWSWLSTASWPGWTIVGSGDFNGDGHPDVVWQNDATRQVQVWYMGGAQGNTMIGTDWISSTGIAGWRVVGVADFDGDGHPDIVWQNDTTRLAVVWFLSGPTLRTWNYLGTAGVPGWKIVAVTDLNGDGSPDLIWQNDITRGVTVWFMGGTQNTSMLGWTYISQNGIAGWKVVGAVDLNGDGYPDLIWQNDTSRAATVWYMGGLAGTTMLSWDYVSQGGVAGWTMVAR